MQRLREVSSKHGTSRVEDDSLWLVGVQNQSMLET